MKIIVIGAVAAAVAAMGGAPEAFAKPDKDKHHRVMRHDGPPGLAKKPHAMPPGQLKKMRRYARGERLPRAYYASPTYYIAQPARYSLPPAPYGYRYVRVGNDVYLAQTRTGLISQVLLGLLG